MTAEEKFAAAEAIWAKGPRKFQTGDLYVGVPFSKGAGVEFKGQKLPIVHSLPRDDRVGQATTMYGHQVRKHADGTYSTYEGLRLADSADQMRKHCALTGYTWERG